MKATSTSMQSNCSHGPQNESGKEQEKGMKEVDQRFSNHGKPTRPAGNHEQLSRNHGDPKTGSDRNGKPSQNHGLTNKSCENDKETSTVIPSKTGNPVKHRKSVKGECSSDAGNQTHGE